MFVLLTIIVGAPLQFQYCHALPIVFQPYGNAHNLIWKFLHCMCIVTTAHYQGGRHISWFSQQVFLPHNSQAATEPRPARHVIFVYWPLHPPFYRFRCLVKVLSLLPSFSLSLVLSSSLFATKVNLYQTSADLHQVCLRPESLSLDKATNGPLWASRGVDGEPIVSPRHLRRLASLPSFSFFVQGMTLSTLYFSDKVLLPLSYLLQSWN